MSLRVGDLGPWREKLYGDTSAARRQVWAADNVLKWLILQLGATIHLAVPISQHRE